MIARKAKKAGGPTGRPPLRERAYLRVRIVPDGAVGGEDAGSGDVHESHPVPPLGVLIGQAGPLVGVPVALEVGQQQVLVRRAAVAEQEAAGDVVIGHAVAEAHVELVDDRA